LPKKENPHMRFRKKVLICGQLLFSSPTRKGGKNTKRRGGGESAGRATKLPKEEGEDLQPLIIRACEKEGKTVVKNPLFLGKGKER